MDVITSFCRNAKSIKCNTEQIDCLTNYNIPIVLSENEIWRSIDGGMGGNTLFHMNLNLNSTLTDEMYFMRTIEMYLPNVFSWRYNGEHIECLAEIPITNQTLGIFTRYKTINNFIFRLQKHLFNILKTRHLEIELPHPKEEEFLLATGSINMKSGTYVINIIPSFDEFTILKNSRDRIITDRELAKLNMKFWSREINPDFFKDNIPSSSKIKITNDIFNLYPPCILNLAKLPNKGNYGRYLLATYLLNVHHERDAKYQMDTILSDEEREHINEGNCKGQWRAITAKQYPCPGCKVMKEHKHCPGDCGFPSPKTYTFMKKIESNTEVKND